MSGMQCPGKHRRGEWKESHDHQKQGVQQENDPIGSPDVVEHDVVVRPYLSDEQEREDVRQVGRPERKN
jgi:hypothetical protein